MVKERRNEISEEGIRYKKLCSLKTKKNKNVKGNADFLYFN